MDTDGQNLSKSKLDLLVEKSDLLNTSELRLPHIGTARSIETGLVSEGFTLGDTKRDTSQVVTLSFTKESYYNSALYTDKEFRSCFIEWYWTKAIWSTYRSIFTRRTFSLDAYFICAKSGTKFKIKRRSNL